MLRNAHIQQYPQILQTVRDTSPQVGGGISAMGGKLKECPVKVSCFPLLVIEIGCVKSKILWILSEMRKSPFHERRNKNEQGCGLCGADQEKKGC